MRNITEKESAELNIPLRKANFWFVVIWLIMVCDYMDRMAINAVLPLLKKEFNFTDAQTGLVSSVVSIAMMIFAPLVAMLADRYGRRKLISAMVAIWSLATYATGKAVGFYTLILARLGVGSGEAGYNSSGASLISVWYPKRIRGIMMGLFFSAQAFGSATGVAVGGYLAHRFGWRACFGILAVPGLLLAALAWFIPDYKAQKIDDKNDSSRTNLLETLSFIVKSPSIIFSYFTIMFIAFNLLSFSTWGVTLFVRTFDMNIEQASRLLGIASLIGFTGSPFAGWIADKILKRNKKGRIITVALMMAVSCMAATVMVYIGIPAKNLHVSVLFMIIAVFCAVGLVPCIYSTVQDIAPPSLRTTAAGFILLFSGFGSFSGPVVSGYISDRTDLTVALQLVVVFSTSAVLFFSFLAARFFNRDMKRAEEFGTFEIKTG